MTRVLGLDPGAFESGFCLLDVPGGRLRPRWLESGNADATPTASMALLERLAPELVCVEEPVQAGKEASTTGLLLAAWHGGGFEYLACARGIRVAVLFAREWRVALTNAASPSNKVIKWFLPKVVDGIPVSTNNHERDACGVAWWGSRLPIIARDIRRAQAEMKARAKGHKAARTAMANRLAKAVGR